MQEQVCKRPVAKLEAWEMMKQPRPDPTQPQPSLPVYFNNADEKKEQYCAEFIKLHPEVEDPMSQEIDETAMMLVGGGTPHGRPLCAAETFNQKGTIRRSRLPSPEASPVPRVLDSLGEM